MESIKLYRGFLKSDRWEEWKVYETDQRRGVQPPPPQKPYPDHAVLVDLIAPEDLTIGQMPLVEAIRRRRSRREFTGDPLTLEELSFLLWATQGIDEEASQAFRQWLAEVTHVAADEIKAHVRTVPSGGPCHPFETYLLVDRVSGLEAGLYRYLPVEHKLLFLKEAAQVEEDGEEFMRWARARKCAVVFVWTAIPYRTEWRYSIVTHKMIAQESGHICQNLYLACEAIGAGTCAVGAYDQAEVDHLLGVDGEEELAIYVAPAGKVAQRAGD